MDLSSRSLDDSLNLSSFYEDNRRKESDERDAVQKKTFTKWMNKHLIKQFYPNYEQSMDCEDDNGMVPSPAAAAHMRNLAERDARAMEAAARAMEEVTKRMAEASRIPLHPPHPPPTTTTPISHPAHHPLMLTPKMREPPLLAPPPHPKRLALDNEQRMLAHLSMPSAHLKVTTRNDGRSEFDNSLVVSMEINGIMYQGVLFAQHARRV